MTQEAQTHKPAPPGTLLQFFTHAFIWGVVYAICLYYSFYLPAMLFTIIFGIMYILFLEFHVRALTTIGILILATHLFPETYSPVVVAMLTFLLLIIVPDEDCFPGYEEYKKLWPSWQSISSVIQIYLTEVAVQQAKAGLMQIGFPMTAHAIEAEYKGFRNDRPAKCYQQFRRYIWGLYKRILRTHEIKRGDYTDHLLMTLIINSSVRRSIEREAASRKAQEQS